MLQLPIYEARPLTRGPVRVERYREGQEAARFQHPVHLAESLEVVRHVFEDFRRGADVEGIIWPAERLHVLAAHPMASLAGCGALEILRVCEPARVCPKVTEHGAPG